ADRQADRLAGRQRAEADICGGPEDLCRPRAGDLFRRAARLRGHLFAADESHAVAHSARGALGGRYDSGEVAASPAMAVYLARRIIFAGLLVFIVSSASLILTRLAPGDFAMLTLGVDARPDRLEAVRARYGLNRTIAEQYREWLSRAVRLDFGESMQH